MFAALEIEPLHMAGMHTLLCPVFDLGTELNLGKPDLESLPWGQPEDLALLTTDPNRP